MQLSDLLVRDRIACDILSGSKKRVLEQLSELIASNEPDINQQEVFESLINRERLGSTGLGKGVAIPHGRLKASDKTLLAFAQLKEGIDYDAPDNQPVDLLFALVVPPESTQEHLQILAALSEMCRDEQFRQQLRSAHSSDELYTLLTHWAPKQSQ
ncbi:MAG: PTS IIA-like nitrogen regulatory protein PtsN [Gammaproteobacteria bacterium]|nr:PTS IIA-like nitrogen regulatory protein PtsN [Gammaproteobacteria bacterium]